MDDSMIGRWLSELPMDDPTRQRTGRPQLRRFIHHDKPIKYRQHLGSGAEGSVYRVRIEGQVYALKIFWEWSYSGPEELSERQRGYTSPFSHECRAFARLNSFDLNGTFAVKCHGWIKLSDTQLKPIRRRIRGNTRWAIVKDYLPDPVTLDDVPEIRRKMRLAHEARLHLGDIQPRNFRGSFLVDLGCVKTYPYPKRLWFPRRVREGKTLHDEIVSKWQILVRDGTIVEGWVADYLNSAFEEWATREEKEKIEEKARMEASPRDQEISDTETIVPAKLDGSSVRQLAIEDTC
ncbi:hypothetical protein FQN54_004594 [Arachnomyces sp. PD_36]|nr:hypothetical protein FQN54_004594 [Arachnomyces sp. PD_36]